jgi:hypothetical protein
MACCLPVHADLTAETALLPGFVRAEDGLYSYCQSKDLIAQYGIALTNKLPLYTPASPQPMNAYMVTHPDCEVGISGKGMRKISETGLVDSITRYLKEWQDEIVAQSAGAIQFVSDPDDADILISVRQDFQYYGDYSGNGITAKGYSSQIVFEAHKLTAPNNEVVLNVIRQPGSVVSLSSGGTFWEYPPELKGTQSLEAFVTQMLSWYGFGAKMGDNGETVKTLQQALADQEFLDGKVDGVFSALTQDALGTFQQAKGLETTGIVDEATLLALYYNIK